MQTFLPYKDFDLSAKCLDNKRLGNQRGETKTLLNSLLKNGGWSKHPAAKMWKGHEGALCLYGIIICKEWIRRGFIDNMLRFFESLYPSLPHTLPPWPGNDKFHSAHKSNLLRKKPDWYQQYKWNENNDLPYFWPV